MSVRGINPVPQFNGPAHLLDCAAPCFQRCVLILWPPDNVSVRLGKGSYLPLTRHFSRNVETGEGAKHPRMWYVFRPFAFRPHLRSQALRPFPAPLPLPFVA